MALRREDIYEAAFDEDAFERLPALVAESLGARSMIMHWRHRDGAYEALGYSYFTPDWIEAYTANWAEVDPWMIAARDPARANTVFLSQSAVPPKVFDRTALYNDFLRGQGDDTFHCMGGACATGVGDIAVGLHRGARAGEFGTDDLARFEELAPDLIRLLKVKGELASARREANIARQALDRLAHASLIVGLGGRLLDANSVASGMLRRGDVLSVRRGAVVATAQRDAARLAEAIARATARADPSARSLSLARAGGRAPYHLTIAPLPSAGCAIVVFRDPDAEDATLAGRLIGLFGLTQAEALIATDLGRGRSAESIAAVRGVSANTLKAQLASIRAKTGCRRQAEVAALVASLPPLTVLGRD